MTPELPETQIDIDAAEKASEQALDSLDAVLEEVDKLGEETPEGETEHD